MTRNRSSDCNHVILTSRLPPLGYFPSTKKFVPFELRFFMQFDLMSRVFVNSLGDQGSIIGLCHTKDSKNGT